MRCSIRRLIRGVLLGAIMLALLACASTPAIPEGAERAIRTESNGDVVEKYRVGGLLRMVKITPARGVPYYLIDRNGDGRFEPPQGVIRPVYFKLYSW